MIKNTIPGIIKCMECGYILVSNHRHDFNSCGCKNEAFVDGGYDYLRAGAKDLSKIKVVKELKLHPIRRKK